MSCCGDDNPYALDCNGCYNCDPIPRVKGRFGVAWICESPECPCNERLGWEVKFLDTSCNVEEKCREMIQWVNCPPLPRLYPCPPNGLTACASSCSPFISKYNIPKCTCYYKKQQKKCCSNKSQHKQIRFSNCEQRFSNCSCCDDIPVKDTSNGSSNACNSYANSAQQVSNNMRTMNTFTLFENCNEFNSNDNSPNNVSSSSGGTSCCCFSNSPQTVLTTKVPSTNQSAFSGRDCVCVNCTNYQGFGSKSTSTIEKSANHCSQCEHIENGYYSEGANVSRKQTRKSCHQCDIRNTFDAGCNGSSCNACTDVVTSSQSYCECDCPHEVCSCQNNCAENHDACRITEFASNQASRRSCTCTCGDDKTSTESSEPSQHCCASATNLPNEINTTYMCEQQPASVDSSKSGLLSCRLMNFDHPSAKSLLDLLERDSCNKPSGDASFFETTINACPNTIVGTALYPDLKVEDSNEETSLEGKKKRKGKSKKSPSKCNCTEGEVAADTCEKRKWFNFRCWKHKDSSVELKASKE